LKGGPSDYCYYYYYYYYYYYWKWADSTNCITIINGIDEPVDQGTFSEIVVLNWKQPSFFTLIFITASAENLADSTIIRFTISTAAGIMSSFAIVQGFLHNSQLP